MSNKKQLEKMLRLSNITKKSLTESAKSSTIEFIKSVADGNTYAIVRENRIYYIKSTETKDTLLESDFDYLGGLGNRTKNSFRGFDDAVTRLNLMFNDINRVQNISEEVDMVNFSHTLNEDGEYVKTEPLQEKRFVLKQPKPKVKSKPTPEPEFDFGGEGEGTESNDEFDFGDAEGEDSESNDEFDFGDAEGGDEEMSFDTEEGGDTDMEFDTSEEGGDSIKDIQKTTGTLGQQLRDTEDISSDMQKWVAKSVISALNLNTMDDSDRDDIISTLENGGNDEKSNEGGEVDFMDDYMDDRPGEPDLDYGDEILLDGEEDEGPGGYLGFESDETPQSNEVDYMGDETESDFNTRNSGLPMGRKDRRPEPNREPRNRDNSRLRMGRKDIDGVSEPRNRDNSRLPLRMKDRRPEPNREPRNRDNSRLRMGRKDIDGTSYMSSEEPTIEGMSKWNDADNEGGMGWETNEDVSYMGDEYSDEEVERLFDNTENSNDLYRMNNPQETPAKPQTKPGTDTPTPSRPSKSPFTPPSRIRPGEEPRPKADRRRSKMDYMAAEPRPSQEPNESPTIAPTKPGTDRPSRPSKSPFTPPSRIRPGEEPRPKADRRGTSYMDDEDGVEFS